MVIAEQVLSPEQETFIIETTKDFDEDFQKLDLLKQKKVTRKLELITKKLVMGDTSILFKYLEKINPPLVQYISSLYKMPVGHELIIFLFYEDDPLFNRHTYYDFIESLSL
jgi:hypothetical protein